MKPIIVNSQTRKMLMPKEMPNEKKEMPGMKEGAKHEAKETTKKVVVAKKGRTLKKVKKTKKC